MEKKQFPQWLEPKFAQNCEKNHTIPWMSRVVVGGLHAQSCIVTRKQMSLRNLSLNEESTHVDSAQKSPKLLPLHRTMRKPRARHEAITAASLAMAATKLVQISTIWLTVWMIPRRNVPKALCYLIKSHGEDGACVISLEGGRGGRSGGADWHVKAGPHGCCPHSLWPLTACTNRELQMMAASGHHYALCIGICNLWLVREGRCWEMD